MPLLNRGRWSAGREAFVENASGVHLTLLSIDGALQFCSNQMAAHRTDGVSPPVCWLFGRCQSAPNSIPATPIQVVFLRSCPDPAPGLLYLEVAQYPAPSDRLPPPPRGPHSIAQSGDSKKDGCNGENCRPEQDCSDEEERFIRIAFHMLVFGGLRTYVD
jgi:hypothetical protein